MTYEDLQCELEEIQEAKQAILDLAISKFNEFPNRQGVEEKYIRDVLHDLLEDAFQTHIIEQELQEIGQHDHEKHMRELQSWGRSIQGLK